MPQLPRMVATDTLTVIAKVVVVTLGIVISLLAYRAFHRTGSDALRWMAIGFFIITVGMLFGGLVDPLLGLAPNQGIRIQNVLTAIGFIVLVYSIYARLPASANL